jgi:hypothetical protein
MKKFTMALFGLFITLSLLHADAFVKKGKAGSIDVVMTSAKPMAVGDNYFTITLSKNGKPVDNAVIRCKVYMPEMPGMPYMDSQNTAVFEKAGVYKTDLALNMTGTWQIRLYIDTPDGKKQQFKSSLIF